MGVDRDQLRVPAPGGSSSGSGVGENFRAAVVVGARAPELEHFAAQELRYYLEKLFGIRSCLTRDVPDTADVLFLVGSPDTNVAVREAAASRPLPEMGEQGIVLRRVQLRGRPAMLLGGGNPAATLWAVYEMAERWGVRFLLHGDVLPEDPAELLPDLDVAVEPLLKVRQWRVVNVFPFGPESWGTGHYRPVFAQLAKLKFNRIVINTYPWQPFVHIEFGGIARQSAWLWCDFHYPITGDMVGRELFADEPEFWNPDLPYEASYEELRTAGERLLHNIMECAHSLGMACALSVNLTEFPREFAPLFKDLGKVPQMGELAVFPGPQTVPEDPVLTGLATTVLRTTVETYPEADCLVLGVPEFRGWKECYQEAWLGLETKYRLSELCPLNDILGATSKRSLYPGGAQRALDEVKGDIVALYFYDRLLTELRVLEGCRRPDVKLVYAEIAEELFPVLGRILPPGSELLNALDYTPDRVLKRREVLGRLPRQLPSTLICTLHDDNIGVLPQLTTGSLHELIGDIKRHGWAGFSTRYWLIGDHDPCVAYLCRAAWKQTTPELAYRDQVAAICGENCVGDMLEAFREVEQATVILEWEGLGLTFPVPGMMMKHWTAEPMPEDWKKVRGRYFCALEAVQQALGKARLAGVSYLLYMARRLQFGVAYLDAVGALREAAIAEAKGDGKQAFQRANCAVQSARRAIELYASVARDQSDRGAIAVLNEYVYRPLKTKVAELAGKIKM